MQRRDLLKALLSMGMSGLAGSYSSTLFASNAATPPRGKLLVVFLRGAYDGASALVPISSAYYYQQRPKIAVPSPDTSDSQAAFEINADWGLHPNIARELEPLLKRNEFRMIPFAGVPGASRSHFEVQDMIEWGGAGQQRVRQDGLLYRLATLIGTDHAVSFTPSLPIILQGDSPVPNLALGSQRRSRLSDAEMDRILRQYQQRSLQAQVEQAAELRTMNQAELRREMQRASRGAPGTPLFRGTVKRMAELMRERYSLAFVNIGGWDTHINQGTNQQGKQGFFANQMSHLAGGLHDFALAMGEDWQHTGVVVLSEFGRTFAENGNAGTDHGHGSTYWVLGPRLAGFPVVGESIMLSAKTLYDGRDYPVRVDYRQILGEVAGLIYGLDRSRLTSAMGVAPGAML